MTASSAPVPHSFRAQRRVEFADTDAAGIMHFSAFFRYMEQSEHELLRSLGLSVVMHDAQGKYSWPRVSANCDYRSAAKFEDLLNIDVNIARLGEKSVSYAFRFTNSEGKELATGEITAVCCRMSPDGKPYSIPIPAPFADKLRSLAAPMK